MRPSRHPHPLRLETASRVARIASVFCLSFSALDGGTAAAQAPAASATNARARAPATLSGRVRDALRGDAHSAFERATVLFADGDFGGARAEFARAHELGGDPRILYNVAVCDKSLRRYARAIAALRRSLADGGKRLPRPYVEKVHDTIAALAPFVTTLTIRSDEAGATVFLDDDNVGLTPLAEPLSVEVGEHVVSVRKTGFLDMPIKVAVSSDAPRVVDVKLEPAVKRGEAKVLTNLPPGVRGVVLVDGVEVGDAPWTGLVDAGRHTFAVRAVDYVTAQRREAIAFGERRELTFVLARERHEARLRVVTDDPSSILSLDGKVIGEGQFEGIVPSGEHRLRVTRSGGGAEPRIAELALRDDETRTINLALAEPRRGVPTWLWVTGGIVLAGAGVATIAVIASPSTTYSGSSPGTLKPVYVPASTRFGGSP